MLSRDKEIDMNNDVQMDTIKQRNNGDNVDGEDEVQNEQGDKITTYVYSGTLANYLREE